MAFKLKKDEIGGKTWEEIVRMPEIKFETTSEMEEKFRDVIDVWTRF